MDPLTQRLFDVTIALEEEGGPGFLLMLRCGSGFNQKKFKQVCTVLKECTAAWKDSDVVTKIAANLLGGLAHDVSVYTRWSNGIESQRILAAATELKTLVETCLSIPSFHSQLQRKSRLMMQTLVQKLYDATIATEEEGDSGFLFMLSTGKGFDQRKFDHLCMVLEECADAWKDSEVLHKMAAYILESLVPSMIDLANSSDESENQKIRNASSKVSDLVQKCY